MSELRELRRIYDAMAETYDAFDDEPFYSTQFALYEKHLAALAPRLTGRVLDLGCGTGLQTALLARTPGARVTGVDLSGGLLARARERCGGAVALGQADAQRLPFRDGAFDAVVSYGEVFSHLGDPATAFREAARVLKPGGTLVVSVLNRWHAGLLYNPRELARALLGRGVRIWDGFDDQGRPTRYPLKTFTRPQMARLLGAAGFALDGRLPVHVTSTLVPLSKQKGPRASRLFRWLERLDHRLRGSPLSYTAVYTAR